MVRTAHLYFRESADTLKRRVLVYGEPQITGELNAEVDLHLAPKTPQGQEVEEALRGQRGWLMAEIRDIPGVRIVEPVSPTSEDIDFDIHRMDTGDWAEIMHGISNAIAHVLGQGAMITTLDGPI